jgi:hypothetical protein
LQVSNKTKKSCFWSQFFNQCQLENFANLSVNILVLGKNRNFSM